MSSFPSSFTHGSNHVSCEPAWPSGKALGCSKRMDRGSIQLLSSSLFQKVVICGHCFVTLSLTINETLIIEMSLVTVLWLCPSQRRKTLIIEMALIAAHLNAGVILVATVKARLLKQTGFGDGIAIGIWSPSSPGTSNPPPPLLPVPNGPYGFCGR